MVIQLANTDIFHYNTDMTAGSWQYQAIKFGTGAVTDH